MADEASEPRELTPFQIIQRGEDTLDMEGNISFADFSPKVVPADTPEEIVVVPKDESALEPAPSSESTQSTVQKTSETTAPAPVDEADGKPSPSETGKPSSSSVQKTG